MRAGRDFVCLVWLECVYGVETELSAVLFAKSAPLVSHCLFSWEANVKRREVSNFNVFC